jgi:hypothetical protein
VESYLKQGVRRNSDGSRINPRSSSTTFDVRLKYRYTVDGKELLGDEKALRQPADDEKWAEAQTVRESYKVGDAIAVYYHPDKPAKSRFTVKEPPVEFAKDLIFVTVYLLGGGVLFWWGRTLLR